jgi:glycogen debranching enzyme
MSANSLEMMKFFSEKAERFLGSTDRFVNAGVNPGGHYKAVWCRDASYILKDWFLYGRFEDVMQEILFIWSHQISQQGEKIIYGRGSPEMKYLSQGVPARLQKGFSGALPTTIFHGFSEIYGRDPDIDSTALMISATAWILDSYLRSGMISASSALARHNGPVELTAPPAVYNPSTVIEYVVPRMLRAVDYLEGRDVDGDGLLEQGHNEDWMDTVLRAGKIVYSQACWILALTNLSSLLAGLKKAGDADRLMRLARKTIRSVEDQLWLESEGTYIDQQESHHLGRAYKTLTQDVALYLVAATENTLKDVLGTRLKAEGRAAERSREKTAPKTKIRADKTLDAIKNRVWSDKNIPLVTEAELKTTGSWPLHPNEYHNHTFWPWITGIEMLARNRFDKAEDCQTLLSMLTSKVDRENIAAYYEWVHPVTLKGKGAFPFRTGISAIRIALIDILARSA